MLKKFVYGLFSGVAITSVVFFAFQRSQSVDTNPPSSQNVIKGSSAGTTEGGRFTPDVIGQNLRQDKYPAQATFSSALALTKRSQRIQKLYQLVDSIEPSQLGASFEMSAKMGLPAADKKLLENLILQRWVEIDPTAAAKFFDQLPAASKMENIDVLASAWSAYDSGSALTWARSLPPSQARTLAIGHSLASLAQTDAKAALDELQTLDRGTAQTVSVQIYSALMDSNPQLAIKSVMMLSESGGISEAAAQTVAAKWGRTDTTAALKWLSENQNSSPSMTAFASALVNSASAVNPRAVVETLSALSNSDVNVARMRTGALKLWLDADPSSAKSWFAGQPVSAQTDYILNASRNSLNALSVESWLPLVENLPESGAKSTAFTGMMKQWASLQPESALKYATSMQDSALAAKALPGIIQGLARSDPELALTTALTLPKDAARDKTLTNVASIWISKDPVQATTQISGLPDNAERTKLLTSSGAFWSLTNPTAASSWAISLQPGAPRDSVLSAVVEAVAKTHPNVALTTAQSITDAATRAKALSKLPDP